MTSLDRGRVYVPVSFLGLSASLVPETGFGNLSIRPGLAASSNSFHCFGSSVPFPSMGCWDGPRHRAFIEANSFCKNMTHAPLIGFRHNARSISCCKRISRLCPTALSHAPGTNFKAVGHQPRPHHRQTHSTDGWANLFPVSPEEGELNRNSESSELDWTTRSSARLS